ncbi:MAG: cell division protein ZapA [Proteobacteria bacterium]|jgi:cell division protein ZapA (FtsZ GTPase activity inhibitor)|nr:cell division protein ZapA [Pseudomonadota bacterium]NLN63106.1 cell division protein ZapA [Myxococcales bacterium]
MKSYAIKLDGETFSLRSDGEPEAVQRLIAELEERFDKMKRATRITRAGQGLHIMTMVAMMLLNELENLRTRHDQLGSEALDFARDLSAKIDDLLLNGPT